MAVRMLAGLFLSGITFSGAGSHMPSLFPVNPYAWSPERLRARPISAHD